MIKVKKAIIQLFLLAFVGSVVFSCSPEKKLAKNFVKTQTNKSVLLLTTDMLFKSNKKLNILDSLDITDESMFDSVLYVNSDFIQHLDDSKLLSNYMLGLEKELKVFGFEVYKENQISDFMEVDSNAFVVYLAQVELEEAIFPFRDETVYNNSYYYHEHELNSLSVFSWFEINRVNEDKEKNVYFTEDVVVDEVEGEFTVDFFGGDVKYFYTIDSLKPAEIYNFAYSLGRKYAGYTYDLLLNNYIRENLYQGTDTYWRFDPYTQTFFPATDDKFILMSQ
jgi:hypothetical protein